VLTFDVLRLRLCPLILIEIRGAFDPFVSLDDSTTADRSMCMRVLCWKDTTYRCCTALVV